MKFIEAAETSAETAHIFSVVPLHQCSYTGQNVQLY